MVISGGKDAKTESGTEALARILSGMGVRARGKTHEAVMVLGGRLQEAEYPETLLLRDSP